MVERLILSGLDSHINLKISDLICFKISTGGVFNRHFSLLNVNAAAACGYDFLCDGG